MSLHKPWDRDKQFFGERVQAVLFLWDQEPNFVTLLESRIRNLGTKMGWISDEDCDASVFYVTGNNLEY